MCEWVLRCYIVADPWGKGLAYKAGKETKLKKKGNPSLLSCIWD